MGYHLLETEIPWTRIRTSRHQPPAPLSSGASSACLDGLVALPSIFLFKNGMEVWEMSIKIPCST